jgi:predicted nucleotidyltransferase
MGEIRAAFRQLLDAVVEATRRIYGNRLVAVAVFGSVGRGTPRHDSDCDLLIVARDLPRGRLARMQEFAAAEAACEPLLRRLEAREGIRTVLSPVFKTPEELVRGSPLFLDLVDDALILFDPQRFLQDYLEALRERLRALGARRVPYRGAWYWDLKSDYRPGEVFEL